MARMPERKRTFSWWNPEVVDFWLSHVRPHWSVRRAYALVEAVRQEAVDAVTVVCKPNRHVQPCLPGQHIAVTAVVEGVRHQRYYSPTVLPNGRWQFTVKLVEQGLVSSAFHRHLQPGAVLELGKPEGDFHQVPTDKPWLLLAAGSGITPLFSLLHARMQQKQVPPTELLYWATQREQLCFVKQLDAWQAQHENVRFQPFLTGAAALQPNELSGRIDVDELQQRIPDLSAYHVFVCGPPGFVRAAAALQEHAAGWVSETHEPVMAAPYAGQVTVHLAKQAKDVVISAGKSLLEGLEEAGVMVPFGCRRGICNTCHCQRLEGVTEHMLLGAENSGAGGVKLCVSQARTNVSLDL